MSRYTSLTGSVNLLILPHFPFLHALWSMPLNSPVFRKWFSDSSSWRFASLAILFTVVVATRTPPLMQALMIFSLPPTLIWRFSESQFCMTLLCTNALSWLVRSPPLPILSPVYIANAISHTNFLLQINIPREPQRVLMSGMAHLHRKVVRSLNFRFLSTYLLFFFVLLGGLLIPSGGSN